MIVRGYENCHFAIRIEREGIMAFRNIITLIVATALMTAVSVGYSSSAQAHMKRYHYGWHYGWHKSWHQNWAHHHHYAPMVYGSCYTKQWVWTDAGYRWQWANTCDTGLLFGIL
jgi:hypothetical protein